MYWAYCSRLLVFFFIITFFSLNPEIWFGHISGEWFDFSCALLLVRNRHGEILSKELKDTLIIGQRVPRMTVLRQIDALESAWDKQLISLLMQPPQNAEEYERFIVLYKEMDKTDTMFSVSIGRGPNVVDMFFYALPPKRKLHRKISFFTHRIL